MTKIATPHFDFESKKTYIQPVINVVCLQHQQQLLLISGVSTNKASSDVDLEYDKNGGNAGDAW
jgi:hypothetical protein